MFSNKFAFRVVERKSKERLSMNTEEATEEIEYEIKFWYEETIYQPRK